MVKLNSIINIALLAILSLPASAGFERLPAPPGTAASASNQLVSIQATSSINQITDGSFEACNPAFNTDACPDWVEYSTNFGTPICNTTLCGTGGGTTGPRTGNNWAWFGGAPSNETGLIAQNVIISKGSIANIKFYLWFGACGTPDDTIIFSVDTTEFFTAPCNDSRFAAGYQEVEINLSAYSDGLPHDFKWSSIQTTDQITNISLDDISLSVETPTPIPTLSEWAQILLALSLMGIAGWYWQRRAS